MYYSPDNWSGRGWLGIVTGNITPEPLHMKHQTPANLRTFNGHRPTIGERVLIDPSAVVTGVRSNGAKMTSEGWSSFRHDNRRTNFTP